MSRDKKEMEPLVVPGKLVLHYRTYVGSIASKFLVELRDNKKILGMKCPQCNWVYVPPRKTCVKCFAKMDEWVEVSDKGTLMTYAVVHYHESIHPLDPPFAYGVIQLDGADSGLTHILGEVDLQNLKIGMRLQAVFKEERKGNMLDIKYFRPLAP